MLIDQFWNVKFEMLIGHPDGDVKKVECTTFINLEFGEKFKLEVSWRLRVISL